MKIPKDASKNSDLSVLLDRGKCFSVVAAAVKGIVSDSVVDLKSPEVQDPIQACKWSKIFYPIACLTAMANLSAIYSC